MIDKLNNHYSMTNPASVYDEEALTALELAGRTASKVNEVVDLVNQNEKDVTEAKQYMTENLPQFVEENINQMNESGELDKIASDAVASGKVDKGGVGQVTYAMLAQDVRNQFTGGNTPVVGANAVSTDNIVNNSITEIKLVNSLVDILPAFVGKPANGIPAFNIDTATGEITKTSESNYTFITDKTYFTINMAEVVLVNHEDLTTIKTVNVWYDSNTKTLHFYNLVSANEPYFRNMFNMGLINLNNPLASSCVMCYTVNTDLYFHPNHNKSRVDASLEFNHGTNVGNAKIVIDWDNKKLIIPPFSKAYAMHKNGYETIYDAHLTGLELDIPETGVDTYGYLVGGKDGLKILTPNEINAITNWCDLGQLYYFGYFNPPNKKVNFNCAVPAVFAKSISIMGDSISTYTGYVPEGNEVYYTGSNCGVSSVSQTWWKRVCHIGGFTINTNNSWSGSRVTPTTTAGKDAVARAELLDNGTDPDIIIVYMGINDYNTEVALGDYDGKGLIPSTTATFSESYANMLRKIMTRYKKAKLYCCTLPSNDKTTNEVVSPDKNEAGVYLLEYNNRIRDIAKAFGATVIDLESCGITRYNASVYMGDYDSTTGRHTHPNSSGHKRISEKVLKAICEV